MSPTQAFKQGAEHTRHRFLVLDAMRGLAAVTILFWHLETLSGAYLAPHGYLAVDFFFLLSGFVISYAYGRKLDEGWPLAAFMKARFVRLYPLYAAGLFAGAVAMFARRFAGLPALRPAYLAGEIVLGIFLLPLVRASSYIFPLNFPAWSLFAEVLANLVHGLFLRKRSTRTLALWMLACGSILVAQVVHSQTINGGVAAVELPWLLPRVLFSYIAGIVLQRWWTSAARSHKVPASLCFLLLLAILLAPGQILPHGLFDLAAVFVLFPALLVLSSQASAGRVLARPAHLSGSLSYAIYVLHLPLLSLLNVFTHDAVAPRLTAASMLVTIAFITATIAIAYLVNRFFDIPVRAWLRRTLRV